MNNLKFVSVPIHLKNANQYVLAKFGKCVVNFFGFAEKGYGYVGLSHEKEGFLIYEVNSSEDPKAVLLRHAVECPVYKITTETTYSQESMNRGVGMGVAILLTSLDQKVLVTRRAPHMRTFPGVWVPPGGHVEPGESLVAAGLRELKEETGLELNDTSYKLLGLWESIYPHKLELGDPVRQHIVVYLMLKSNLSSQELTKHIKVHKMRYFLFVLRLTLLRLIVCSCESWILKRQMQLCGCHTLLFKNYLQENL